eukprot:2534998-Ditylum_brightwellii.AAC.1
MTALAKDLGLSGKGFAILHIDTVALLIFPSPKSIRTGQWLPGAYAFVSLQPNFPLYDPVKKQTRSPLVFPDTSAM